jgi:hypothetical protein
VNAKKSRVHGKEDYAVMDKKMNPYVGKISNSGNYNIKSDMIVSEDKRAVIVTKGDDLRKKGKGKTQSAK